MAWVNAKTVGGIGPENAVEGGEKCEFEEEGRSEYIHN